MLSVDSLSNKRDYAHVTARAEDNSDANYSSWKAAPNLVQMKLNGYHRPFWMTENHFRSHFSPFQANTQSFFLNLTTIINSFYHFRHRMQPYFNICLYTYIYLFPCRCFVYK